MSDLEEIAEEDDPSVPPDLLELYVELEVAGCDPESFKEAFGEAGN